VGFQVHLVGEGFIVGDIKLLEQTLSGIMMVNMVLLTFPIAS
jgi:hypothetical protein